MFAITKEVKFQLRILTAGSSVLDCDAPHLLLGPTTVPLPFPALQNTSRGPACSHLDFGVCISVVLFIVRRETYRMALGVGLGPLGGKF